MASDSLFSGDTFSPTTGLLDASDRALLDSLLADFVGGPAVNFDSGKLVNGTGPGGEKQGALTPGTGKLDGPITSGDLTMEVDIPAGVGLTFSGKDGQTPDAAENYLNTAIGGYFSPNVDPNSDAGQQQQSLVGAVDDLLGSLGGGKDVSVRLIDFLGKTSPGQLHELTTTDNNQQTFALLDSDGAYQGVDSLVGANEIFFDAGVSKGKQVFALNLSGAYGKTIALANIEAAVLGGPGTVRNEGTGPIAMTSDNKPQTMIGGIGNDTLVGTGNDTLTGGAGNDVFGFNKGGKYVVTDFNKVGDMLAFDIPGVTNLDQLKAKVTSVVKTGSSITYNLGADTSVTLVGITATDLTAAMFKFTLF
jgi:hypothetical protein